MTEPAQAEGRQDYQNQEMGRFDRSASTEAHDMHQPYVPVSQNKYHHQQHPKQPYGYRGMPHAYPPPHPPLRRPPPPGYAPTYPQSRVLPQSRLQNVVTSSFSIEDEREDLYYRPAPIAAPLEEERYPEGVARRQASSDERDLAARDSFGSGREAPPMFDARAPVDAEKPTRIPPSPGDARQQFEDSPTMTSTPTSKVSAEGLKRSFWHHARPVDSSHQVMHPAFIPPKRAKVGTGRREREVVIAPRAAGFEGEYHRSSSWANPDDERQVRPSTAFPAPWPYHVRQASSFTYPESVDEYGRSWSVDEGNRDGAFRVIPPVGMTSRGQLGPYQPIVHQGSFPPPRHWGSRGDSYDWTPSHENWHQHRDDVESRDYHSRSYSREMSWDERDPSRYVPHDSGAPYRYCGHHNQVTPHEKQEEPEMQVVRPTFEGPLRLLCQPEDRISLSETLCTIRENIEVFTATKADVEAPAPGRKHPVVVGQVGLRCIHCRHTTKSSDRVKRAVCYPSSIKRIYRTVIDMKLDHFAHCRFVPKQLKDRLDELKAINTRSTGTTMQYFVRAATKMGMVDATSGSGVRFLDPNRAGGSGSTQSSPLRDDAPDHPSENLKSIATQVDSPMQNASDLSEGSPLPKDLNRADSDHSDVSMGQAPSDESISASPSKEEKLEMPNEIFTGKAVLSLPEDRMALSQLRCFLRENVCAFTATEEDIAVRTPTTFSVVEGQVGIGCVHCLALPAKERSNRAVCFPFAINRIYQSVADIQRFHIGECKMVPKEDREKFLELQSASSKGSKGLATRQYWVTSAKKIGLADTPKGIRFIRDPSAPAAQAVSLDILAQVASNVNTVGKPLVLPDDKPNICEFLYAVMEQLQPCRFTEADRNKRRLKDVGCIGVECRHCAGQVDSRKFFWSSVCAVESNFVSVHTHMMECKMVPQELKDHLSELKKLRKEQTARLQAGSQKAFFQTVWDRLQETGAEHEVDASQEEGVNTVDVSPSANLSQEAEAKPAETDGCKREDSSSSLDVENVSTDIEKMKVISV